MIITSRESRLMGLENRDVTPMFLDEAKRKLGDFILTYADPEILPRIMAAWRPPSKQQKLVVVSAPKR